MSLFMVLYEVVLTFAFVDNSMEAIGFKWHNKILLDFERTWQIGVKSVSTGI